MTIRYNLEHGFAGAKSRSESDCGMPAVGIAIPDPDKQLTSNKDLQNALCSWEAHLLFAHFQLPSTHSNPRQPFPLHIKPLTMKLTCTVNAGPTTLSFRLSEGE